MKQAKGCDGTSAAVGADSAAARDTHEGRRWAREVLRRGAFELLYLGSNLAIVGGAFFWLYRILVHKPALPTGLSLAAAVGVSLFAYHFARWRASALMSRQVEKFAAWLIATLAMALVWGGICFAFTFGALRWFTVPGTQSWMIGGVVGLCGFFYIVAGEGSGLSVCLALPAAIDQSRRADESAA